MLLLKRMCPLLPLLLATLVTSTLRPPTMFVSVLVRNKEPSLPYFLSSLQKQTYPKDRMILYFRSDHNQDRSLEVLKAWLSEVRPLLQYHDIIVHLDPECETKECLLPDETDPVGWTDSRFEHVMKLRQEALELARFSLADYFLSLDCDVLLTNPRSLELLVEQEKLVVAPLLQTTGLYSNFWAGMSDTFYYLRTDEYRQILDRKTEGCYEVPMVHTAVLVDLRHTETDLLAYMPENVLNYPGPRDDIIVFALSARLNNIPLVVCNEHQYGVLMVPLEEGQSLTDDQPNLLNTLLEATVKSDPLEVEKVFQPYMSPLPEKTTLGLDKIFMINLARRTDRAQRMKYNLDMLGLAYQWVAAVDGTKMTENYLLERGVIMLPEFSEPYHGRPLTFGEIGCFLSHYDVWQQVLDQDLDTVLVLEDDIKFEPYFVDKLDHLLAELHSEKMDDKWDLVFLGRKILHNSEEPWLEGSEQLVKVDYTYWTLAYLLTKAGARKLVSARPLDNMVPVDEFLPIMYDRHPNKTWSEYFPLRDLQALSVHPLLVFPTHYTGDKGYVSDTEGTSTIRVKEEL